MARGLQLIHAFKHFRIVIKKYSVSVLSHTKSEKLKTETVSCQLAISSSRS